MFLLPGVAHCGGGPGPDQVDWITAIEQWVEQDIAPERLIAAKRDDSGNATMLRPVCAYPATAVYDGQGDPNLAESFVCTTVQE
jgi:feruloyl esterase